MAQNIIEESPLLFSSESRRDEENDCEKTNENNLFYPHDIFNELKAWDKERIIGEQELYQLLTQVKKSIQDRTK